jgi:hypothetical protein
MQRIWSNYLFERVCDLRPEADGSGKILEFIPHGRYRNQKCLSLNPYGQGPFCKFRVPSNQRCAGVYVLTVDAEAVYVGECVNLSSRYNNGYGNISPRNCYEGGQRTNCRINHLVYKAASDGRLIDLWFLKTARYKTIESELINSLQPAWNRRGIITLIA